VSITGAVRYGLQALFGGALMLKVGDPAPEFEATDHRGRRVKLSDYRGKKVVLWFFPKAETPG
jgi:peroxiredoxin Q/BCP